MVWESMDWNGLGTLVEMEGWMDAEQYVSILQDKLLPSMENRALSFNRIITLNTPPKGLKTGSNLKGLGFLIGHHSHQTLALLSTSGNISRKTQWL